VKFFLLLSQVFSARCINGIQLAKIELLIDRTSSIYLKVRLKALTSVITLYLKEKGAVCSHRYIDDLLKHVVSELDKTIIDEELQHIDDIIFCVVHITFCFLLDKIS
jgi:hypothetical protein